MRVGDKAVNLKNYSIGFHGKGRKRTVAIIASGYYSPSTGKRH